MKYFLLQNYDEIDTACILCIRDNVSYITRTYAVGIARVWCAKLNKEEKLHGDFEWRLLK